MGKVERYFIMCMAILAQFGCERPDSLVRTSIVSEPGYVSIGGDTSMCSTLPFNSFNAWIDFDRLGLLREEMDSIVWTGGYLYFREGTDSLTLQNADTGTYHLLFYQFPEVDSVALHLYQCLYTLYIPNAFSPNGDGLNDVWFPVNIGLSSLYWEVRSPHGEFIFSSDMGENWDGEWEGNPAPPAYYIYRVRFTFVLEDEEQETQGYLELYR